MTMYAEHVTLGAPTRLAGALFFRIERKRRMAFDMTRWLADGMDAIVTLRAERLEHVSRVEAIDKQIDAIEAVMSKPSTPKAPDVGAQEEPDPVKGTRSERIIEYVKKHGPSRAGDIMRALGGDESIRRLIYDMAEAKRLTRTGSRCVYKYWVPGKGFDDVA